jgi:glycosyltransferase involved in cell wall biosynthesis
MKKTVSVIGHFAEGLNLSNGQTIKTRIVTDALKETLGEKEIGVFDTHGGKLTLLKAPFQCLSALSKARNVIILPAHNGIRVYAPLLRWLRPLFKKRRLHYVVIGGWLPEFLKKRKGLKKALLRFDGIYVETSFMKKALEEQGFSNVYVMPNFKDLPALKEQDLVYPSLFPLRLCTFSRVNAKKGIEDAVEAVKAINEKEGYAVYSLDIYGSIDAGQEEWFESLKKEFPDYIHYCGAVPYEESVAVLKDYYALLFPTHYFTEGIPGTIIDAYASGVPVIASKWQNYCDIVDEGKTGISYPFEEKDGLKRVLTDIMHEPKALLDMRQNCLLKAKDYSPDKAIKVLDDALNSGGSTPSTR